MMNSWDYNDQKYANQLPAELASAYVEAQVYGYKYSRTLSESGV